MAAILFTMMKTVLFTAFGIFSENTTQYGGIKNF